MNRALYRVRHGRLDAQVGTLRGERLIHRSPKLGGQVFRNSILRRMRRNKPRRLEFCDLKLPELEMLELCGECGGQGRVPDGRSWTLWVRERVEKCGKRGSTLHTIPEAIVVAQMVLGGNLCENAAIHDVVTLRLWRKLCLSSDGMMGGT